MDKWIKKTACVAGANSGMGFSLTKYFLDFNMKVIAVDKITDNLNELKSDDENGDHLMIIQVDVTKEDELLKSIQTISENIDEINIVTYSIGCVGNSNLIDGDFTEWKKLVSVNVIAFCSFMKEITNLMIKQNVRDGRIIIMNSIVVLDCTVFPELHFYAATKCAVDAISKSLEYEIREKNGCIKISNLYVGLVKTDMYKNSLGSNFETTFFKTLMSLSVEDVNQCVEYILKTPTTVKVNRMVIGTRGIFKQNTLF